MRPSSSLYVLEFETALKRWPHTLACMDVTLIRWPAEGSRRLELAERDLPRLLLLGQDDEPPICHDPLEDWVRVPAPGDEVRARVDSLLSRFKGHQWSTPGLDDNGLLRFRGVSTQLTPLQARLVARMLSDLGAVVTRSDLLAAGWRTGEGSPNSLEAQLARLRRRIAALDLEIRTVRSRGYMIDTLSTESSIA